MHVETKPILNPGRKLTGATIGYNVIICNQTCVTICDYQVEKKSSSFLTRIASHPRSKLVSSRLLNIGQYPVILTSRKVKQ